MPNVMPVTFEYAAHELWFDPRDTGAVAADHVICRTARGLEIGIATGDVREVSHRQLRGVCGDSQLRPIERIATQADLERAEMLADRGDAALVTFRRLVEASGLDMKPVGVEWLFGGGKVVCYFAAEERVDFRQLVRDLSRELHERIDMRQIGVREAAAVVGGYAHCGQELCCARFGRQFEPVSIRMAKEQDLPLNSTKISGVCGRLMCCLRYEFEAYRDFKARAPKRNAVIDTPLGTAKIVEYDTPKEQLVLRLANGKQLRIALADMEASDAARKKSEDLGCACRPDTITRQALDRLQSPEVQLALAELDRAAGIPKDGADTEASASGARQRRRRRAADRGGGASGGVEPGSADPGATARTRRRRRRGGEGSPVAPAPQEAASQADGEGEQPSKGRRRRRHHSATAKADGVTPTQQRGASQGEARTRRRPGDKGGTQPRAEESRHKEQAAGGGSAPRRRRRHRRRGGAEAGGGTGE